MVTVGRLDGRKRVKQEKEKQGNQDLGIEGWRKKRVMCCIALRLKE